jgi:hypothetical protein
MLYRLGTTGRLGRSTGGVGWRVKTLGTVSSDRKHSCSRPSLLLGQTLSAGDSASDGDSARLSPLVLQLELGCVGSQPPLVMTGLSHGLMMTPKERPGQRMGGGDHLVPEQLPDHAKDLWHRVGDHPTANPLWDLKCCKLLGPGVGFRTFFPGSAFAWSIISVAHHWANSERVMCRYQPVQRLTSY